jgi:methionyl-tRNA formyltransferase
MVARWRKTCENLEVHIRELNPTPAVKSEEENLTFMFHRAHAMFKEYEQRQDRIKS